MRNTLWVKFIAIALCAACLAAAAGSAVSLLVLAHEGLLEDGAYEAYLDDQTRRCLPSAAQCLAEKWASVKYGGMPEEMADGAFEDRVWRWLNEEAVSYEILDEAGKIIDAVDSGVEPVQTLEYPISALGYQKYLDKDALADHPDAAWGMTRDRGNSYTTYRFLAETLDTPVTVRLSLGPDAIQPNESTRILGILSGHRVALGIALAAGLLLFAASAVFLCSVAGCKKGTEEIRAGGLNALPLDLYAAGVIGIYAVGVYLCQAFFGELGMKATLAAAAGALYAAGVLFVCFCFAFAAQVKMGHGHWFWNTVAGRCLKLAGRLLHKLFLFLPELWRFVLRIVRDVFKVAGALVTLLWSWAKTALRFLGRLLRRVGKLCERTLSLLPLTWQWIVTGGVLAVWLLLACLRGNEGAAVLWCVAALVAVMYGSNCFGTLLDAAKRMRGGDLESKVEEKYLVGCFREFADELNGLADVAMVAAQNQLKSERMKTELITNVSHDIKTPLTSIINYVDLLEKPHTAEEEKTYVEVLSRQSQRLKKLIDDLMEMSKASTGNVQVEIARIDAVEAVTQALGEFSDKLTAAGLTPVFHQSEEAIFLLADGRLLWRAMSNVLSNAVKYALPGTRLYVDVSAAGDKAIISFKNISGAQLNISAEELMERFVRGDSSRNTEGSGLGLNIAKSLMELQKGQLQLLVDGDLFKVTLVFPRAD